MELVLVVVSYANVYPGGVLSFLIRIVEACENMHEIYGGGLKY